jgi:hypothetical protein
MDDTAKRPGWLKNATSGPWNLIVPVSMQTSETLVRRTTGTDSEG